MAMIAGYDSATAAPRQPSDQVVATVDMSLIRVSENTYYVEGAAGAATHNQGFISNAGVIVGEQGVVLVDTLGTPALARLLLQKIRQVIKKPIEFVILTHYHADHIYGLQIFEETGATILAPRGAENYLMSEAASQRLEERRVSLFPWVNEDTRLIHPDRYVEEDIQLDLGNVTLTLTPLGAAHSDGDLAVYVEPDGVLFSGDIIFEGRLPFVGDANTRNWLHTLDRIEKRALEALVPGHGPAAQDPNKTIALTRRYLAFLRENLGAAVAELQAFDEVYPGIDWSEFSDLPAFKEANRRNAYQVYLSMEAEILAEEE